MRNKRNVIAGILAVICMVTTGSLLYVQNQQNNKIVRVDNHEESICDAAGEVIVATEVETLQEIVEEVISEVPEEVEEAEPALCGWELLDPGITVSAPVDYSPEEVADEIRRLAKEDERYQVIAEHYGQYPYYLIKDLVNNPEMLSFVLGYPGDDVTEKDILPVELEQVCPLFLQWDPRWGYEEYGAGTNIAVSGCGPTALAMVATGLTHTAVSPAEVAEFAIENGYRVMGSGTTWGLMRKGCREFGISSKELSLKEDALKAALDEGKLMVISVKGGDFTLKGHYMVIHGYDEEGFYVNDPMCIYRSKQKWPYKVLGKQLKGAWAFEAMNDGSTYEELESQDTDNNADEEGAAGDE